MADSRTANRPRTADATASRWKLIVLLVAFVAASLVLIFWPRPPLLINLIGHRKGVNDITFNADGSMVATASDDGTIRLWTDRGDSIKTITGHSERVAVVRFTPDSRRVVSASGKGKMRIWDVETGVEVMSLDGHQECVADMDFSDDGQLLASVGWDLALKVWNIDTGKLVYDIEAPAVLECCVFTPDGKRVITGGKDRLIRLWDLDTKKYDVGRTLGGCESD